MKVSLKDFSLKALVAVPQFWRRFLCMVLGILCMGLFLSLLIAVGWGTDPYTFQNTTVAARIGWTLGTWQLALNAAMFVVVLLLDWRLIGLGTLVNWVLVGYTADFFGWLWPHFLPMQVFSAPGLFWLKAAVFVAALLGFVISASFYMNAQLGLSPYDAMAWIWGHTLARRLPPFLARIIFDLVPVAVGVLVALGTRIDVSSAIVGSLAMAFALGPAIQIVGRFMNRHILKIRPE